MAGLDMLQDVLLLVSAFAVGVACTLLFVLYRRMKSAGRAAEAGPFRNMAEMSILFQTMRGLVREQKALARDFNRSLDAKVEVVREAVRQVIAGHEQLMRMQKAFKAQLEQAAAAPLDKTAPSEEEEPVFQAIAEPQESDIIDRWVFQSPPEEPDSEPRAEDLQPLSEADSAEAREAIGALLNMGEPPEPAEPVEHTAAPAAAPAAVKVPTNGAAALRARVFKYHDAGMSVAAIAQELGVGKGEIRLMLSLREK